MNWHVIRTPRSTRAAGSVTILASCMLAVLLGSGCRQEAPPQPTATESSASETAAESAQGATGTVTLEIFHPNAINEDESGAGQADFRETFDVANGTTLEEVMRKIEQPEIVITGSGVTAFVQSMDGVATDTTRAWTYTVDGTFANEGIGSLELTPPQKIQWRFTTLDEATK